MKTVLMTAWYVVSLLTLGVLAVVVISGVLYGMVALWWLVMS